MFRHLYLKIIQEGDKDMFKSYSMELAGRTLTVEVGRVAAQANGAALMHYGDTVVLSTATASENSPRTKAPIVAIIIKKFSSNTLPCKMF